MTDPILDALDPEQRQVALLLDAPLVVLAGAGTGKTRAITHRVAHAVREGRYAPNATLAVTFTTRAAGELKTRLAGLGVRRVTARTIHAAALSQCRYFWPGAYGSEFPAVADNAFSLVARAANQVLGSAETTLVRDLAAELSWAKSSNVPPSRYVDRARGRDLAGVEPEQVAQVMVAYEKAKSLAGVVDFDDILLCAASMIAERPEVAEQIRATYRHFVVDEYQDVSAIQHRLISLWTDDRPDICVVGDPQQAIHGFAGARADFLLGFAAEHDGARTVRLVRNYRSSGAIVDLANRVVRRHRGAADLRASGQQGSAPEFVAAGTEEDEAKGVVAWLQERREEGMPWSECAVLYRINAQSPVMEAVLDAARIPYRVKGTDRFWERTEVRDVVNRLQRTAIDHPTATPRQLLDLVLAAIRWNEQAPSGMGAQRERWESIAALVQLIRDQDALDPEWSIPEFGAWLNDHATLETPPVSSAVTLATMHAAKGLEWDAVAVIGVREGMVPFALSQEEPALSEERRLLHVAVTRARQRLRISWPSDPARGRGTRSRFLTGLVPRTADRIEQASAGRKGSLRSRTCRVCQDQLHDATERKLGRHLTCEAPYDEALLAVLKQWRLETAKAASQPAFVVFTDATLQAIAEAEPTDRASLLRLPGIGAAKVDRHGEAVLEVIANHLGRR
ncbi:ATP-dependent DNA helicase UvrD2 [Arachnia propionica]|uniref:ATP-dependent DNA helicase UvrD2 n=1 Tax=Arachnia propionica TaxID=1750 RepID=UPI0021AB999C|nr:ATP-dependent DNA helicase UvrD2 [Arachnia propionica]